MSDTMQSTELPMLVGMMAEKYREFATGIGSIDEKLNTDGGRAALTRTAVENYPESADIAASVQAWLVGRTPEQLLAIVGTVRKELRAVDSQVSTYVEANKADAPTLSDEDATALREERKGLVAQANAMRVAAKASDPAWATEADNLDRVFPEFSNLRGGGPRKSAPRFRGSYVWAIDGTVLGSDKLADVAKKLHVGPTEFKLAMQAYYEAKGIEFDLGSPPDHIDFVYTTGDASDPDGHADYRVTGTRRESDDEEEDDETDNETVATDDDGSVLFSDD